MQEGALPFFNYYSGYIEASKRTWYMTMNASQKEMIPLKSPIVTADMFTGPKNEQTNGTGSGWHSFLF